jgi:hypothetical protein
MPGEDCRMTHDSQRLKILRVLASGETLTTMKAFSKLKCTTLSQRCGDLRKQRIPVQSRMVGNGRNRYCEYWIPAAKAALVKRMMEGA